MQSTVLDTCHLLPPTVFRPVNPVALAKAVVESLKAVIDVVALGAAICLNMRWYTVSQN